MYRDFCDKLQRVDLRRDRNEAPGSYALRVAALRPDLALEVASITRVYDAICYRSEAGEDVVAVLKRQVRKFTPARR